MQDSEHPLDFFMKDIAARVGHWHNEMVFVDMIVLFHPEKIQVFVDGESIVSSLITEQYSFCLSEFP